ncbi:MAG: alpha/beta fold hydrolase [Ilumatobacteraceae bacterium]
MATAADRITRLALRNADAIARSALYPPAIDALIEGRALLAEQRRLAETVATVACGRTSTWRRRRRKELAERRVLDPARAATADVPAVWWHEDGSADAPAILLLNGWTASGLMWPGELVDRLAREHRVLRVDNRGTGWSRTVPGAVTMRAMADDAADVLRAGATGPAIVVGLSMGGMIAQELTLRHPGLVAGLVLTATRPPAPAHVQASPAVLRMVTAEPAAGASRAATVGRMWAALCGPGFVEEHPELVEELVGQVRRRVTPAAAVNAQMLAIAAWSGADRLCEITVPTTVVHGDHDRLLPVGNGMRLSRLIPGAEYVEVPGVGHLVPMEAPDALVDAVRQTGKVARITTV